MRGVRSNSRIAKASNHVKEGVIRVLIKKKSIRRNMMNSGRRETVDNEHHTLEHMIPIIQGYG
jgi:hypothetical protein